MALFCSPCKSPILCTKFRRNYAIQQPFMPKTLIPKNPNFDISKIAIYGPAKPKFIDSVTHQAKCSSSLSHPGELDKEAPSSLIIFIKGLAQSTSEKGLNSVFSRFGDVSRVKIIVNKKTKQSLGFGYVWFAKSEDAETAVNEMNGQFLDGRFIHVAFAKPGSCKTHPDPSPYKF